MPETEESNSSETTSAAQDVKVDSQAPKAGLPSKPDDKSAPAPATTATTKSSKPTATPEPSLPPSSAQNVPKETPSKDKEPSPPPYTPRKEEVKPPESEKKRVYIAVMGQTGTGKSTFINQATGANLEVGHTMGSCMLLHPVKFVHFRHSADKCEQVRKK